MRTHGCSFSEPVLLSWPWTRSLQLAFHAVISLFLVLVCPTPAGAQTQQEHEAVYVVSSDALLNTQDGEIVLLVTGKVTNALEEEVRNVVVGVWIPGHDASELLARQVTKPIERIKPGKAKQFSVSLALTTTADRYVALVVEYELTSTDIDRLFDYFWNSDKDSGLRRAAASRLENFPLESFESSLQRFQDRPDTTDLIDIETQLVEDLLLLPGLSGEGNADAVPAILAASEVYADSIYEATFLVLRDMAASGDTIISLLNSAAADQLCLCDILRDALVRIGDQGLPSLVSASYGPAGPQSDLAVDALRAMGRATVQAQLAVADTDIRRGIIEILAQTGDASVVDALLELDDTDAATHEVVVSALLAFGPEVIPKLGGALDSPIAYQRALAADALRAQSAEALPALTAALEARDPTQPHPTSVEAVVAALVAAADAARIERVQALVDQAAAALADGECRDTTLILDAIDELDREYTQANATRARAYACLGNSVEALVAWRAYLIDFPEDKDARAELEMLLLEEAHAAASKGDIDEAIEFAIEACTLSPTEANATLLSDLHLTAARDCYAVDDWECALEHYAEAGDSPAVRTEVGKLLLARNFWYVVGGVLSMVLVVAALFLLSAHLELDRQIEIRGML